MAEKTFMSANAVNTPEAEARRQIERDRQKGVVPKDPTVNVTPSDTTGLDRVVSNPKKNVEKNPYVHDTNNIVPSSGNSTISAGQMPDTGFTKIDFLPNVLDNYDVVTYHWKLFILEPDATARGTVFKLDKQTIIAESGVTDLTIDKVDIWGITSPSVESGTGVMTGCTFEIVEPAGAALIDKLFYQSVALGIGTWANMPVYLQLQFKNRDPVTSEADSGDASSLASLKWLWTLKITNIKAHVTHVGTRYEFTATVYDEFAQSNANFTIQHNAVLNNIETFGSAMQELEDKLNSDQVLKLLDSYSIPDIYRIVVDPQIADYKITPNKKNTNPRRNDNFEKFENKDATFQPGTSVDKIIDSLLSQTEEFQKSLIQSRTAGGNTGQAATDKTQMRDFWRIVTETRPLKFDPRRQTIACEFTIFVIKYDLGLLNATSTRNSKKTTSIDQERKRLKVYADKKILKKKYDYIFTGLNDQIINFDLVINNAFAVSQARYGGVYQNTAMSDMGVVAQNHAKDEAKVADIVGKAIALQNNAKTAKTAAAQKALEEAKQAVKNSELTAAQKKAIEKLLDNSKPESRLAFLQDTVNNGGLNGSVTRAVNLAKPVTEKITQQQFRFISDVDITSPEAIASQEANEAERARYTSGDLRPIARVEAMQDRQTGLGVEAASNSGIQKLSSMFAVALYSSIDGSFTRIKLTIKGDPFWLFPQPFVNEDEVIYNSLRSDEDAIDWIKKAHFRMEDAVNTQGTDNFIIIRFRTPRVFNVDENPDDSNTNVDVATFSGVFKVTRITNKFESGKFTQELECLIDTEINIANLMDVIEGASGRPDVGVRSTASETVVPVTSVKKQKIKPGNTLE